MIRFLAKEIHDVNIMFGDVALPNMLSGPLSARPSIYPLDSLDNTTCAKRSPTSTERNSDDTGAQVSNNEMQWVLFDDRIGTKKGADYVNEEKNQKNCYMIIYELQRSMAQA